MKRLIVLSFLSVVFGACTSIKSPEPTLQENSAYIDLTAESDSRLANEYWIEVSRRDPGYPIEAAKKGISGCVELIVGINSEGTVNGYQIRDSYPKGVFDKKASASLKYWKWEASEKNKDRLPILTTIQLDFMVQGTRNLTKAEKHCGFKHFSL